MLRNVMHTPAWCEKGCQETSVRAARYVVGKFKPPNKVMGYLPIYHEF